MDYVKKNLAKLEETITGKQNSLRGKIIYNDYIVPLLIFFFYIAIVNVMQDKIQEQSAKKQ